jgi:hypothetical protein
MSQKTDEELAWHLQDEELELQQQQRQRPVSPGLGNSHAASMGQRSDYSQLKKTSYADEWTHALRDEDEELQDVMLASRLQHEEDESLLVPPSVAPNKSNGSHDSKPFSNPTNIAKSTEPSSHIRNNKSSWSILSDRLSQFSDIIPSETCSKCAKPLFGRYLRLPSGELYHRECFLCAGCYLPIEGKYVVRDGFRDHRGGAIARNDRFFHESCAEALFAERCRVCDKVFRNGEQFFRHSFFIDRGGYCSSHESDGSPSCCSCNLKGARKDPLVTLPDGRHLCNDCISTAIFESSEAIPIYDDILHFFQSELNLMVPLSMRSVPVLVVDLPSLNDQQRLNNFKNMHGGVSLVRGLTLSTTETSIRYTVPAHLVSSADLIRTMPGGFVHSLTKPHSVVYNVNDSSLASRARRDCVTCRSVTAVLVLCGLPRVLASSILAHEAMHVWCKLSSMEMPLDLPSHVEEGLCQLVSWRYLEYLKNKELKNSASSWEGKLTSYYQYLIEIDGSPDYGDGFRRAAGAAAAIGLEELLHFVHDSKNLPNI